METHSFLDAPWHDAELRSIFVDRSRAGLHDSVRFEITWPTDARGGVEFTHCYRLECSMNFGIVAEESIRYADMADDSEALREVRARWMMGGVDLRRLKEFRIETNSTASVIRVLAMDATVDLGE